MPFGITNAGFTTKRLEQITADLAAKQRATMNPALDTTATSPVGQQNGIVGSELALLWERLEQVHAAFDPDNAEGSELDAVSAITGTRRLEARESTIEDVTVNLDAATTLPAGSVAHVVGNPTARFVTAAEVISVGAGNYTVDFVAEATGPLVALSGTLTEIADPVTGWNSVTNPTDAELGANIEADPAMRVRREIEAAGGGSSNVDAIRAEVRQVVDVLGVQVFENTEHVVVDGRAPKSFEVVVLGGAADAIAQAIWDTKPAGIQSFGVEDSGGTPLDTGVAVDQQGQSHLVPYSRPTELPIYVAITILYDQATYAGDDAVKQEIIDYVEKTGSHLGDPNAGSDIRFAPMLCAAHDAAGVTNITVLFLGTSPAPTTEDDIIVSDRQFSTLDSSDIDLTASVDPEA